MANGSYFQLDDDDNYGKVHIFSQSSQEKLVNWKRTVPYIAQIQLR